MDLTAAAQFLGNVGEFISAIAVVVTLFYLAVQVRHGKEAVEANTRSLEANRNLAMGQAYQTRCGHVQTIAIARAESPHWPQMQLKVDAGGLDALTPEERLRYVQLARAQALIFDNIHYQYGLGLIDDEFYESTFKIAIQRGGTLNDAEIIGTMRPSFVAEVERLHAEYKNNPEGAAVQAERSSGDPPLR